MDKTGEIRPSDHNGDANAALLMDEEERSALASLSRMCRAPVETVGESTIMVELRSLQRQVDQLRLSIPRFDQMLAKRKTILQGTVNPNTGLDDHISDGGSILSTSQKPSHIRQGSVASSHTASPIRAQPARRLASPARGPRHRNTTA